MKNEMNEDRENEHIAETTWLKVCFYALRFLEFSTKNYKLVKEDGGKKTYKNQIYRSKKLQR